MTKQAAKPTLAAKKAAAKKPAVLATANVSEITLNPADIMRTSAPEGNEIGTISANPPGPAAGLGAMLGEAKAAVLDATEDAKLVAAVTEFILQEAQPLHRLEQAQSLPEVDQDAWCKDADESHAAFTSFKDEDRRTMRIVKLRNGELAKQAVQVKSE